MKSGINNRIASLLLGAGLAFGVAAAAQAASGVSITEIQEPVVAVGMTQSQVEQALGRPADVINYPFAAGPTWSYNVEDATFGVTSFDVDFGGDGKVTYSAERVLGNS